MSHKNVKHDYQLQQQIILNKNPKTDCLKIVQSDIAPETVPFFITPLLFINFYEYVLSKTLVRTQRLLNFSMPSNKSLLEQFVMFGPRFHEN